MYEIPWVGIPTRIGNRRERERDSIAVSFAVTLQFHTRWRAASLTLHVLVEALTRVTTAEVGMSSAPSPSNNDRSYCLIVLEFFTNRSVGVKATVLVSLYTVAHPNMSTQYLVRLSKPCWQKALVGKRGCLPTRYEVRHNTAPAQQAGVALHRLCVFEAHHSGDGEVAPHAVDR